MRGLKLEERRAVRKLLESPTEEGAAVERVGGEAMLCKVGKRGGSRTSSRFLFQGLGQSFPGMGRMGGGWRGDVYHADGQNGVELQRIIETREESLAEREW